MREGQAFLRVAGRTKTVFGNAGRFSQIYKLKH